MVARAPKTPLVCEEITVDPPKAGEVRVKVVANGEYGKKGGINISCVIMMYFLTHGYEVIWLTIYISILNPPYLSPLPYRYLYA